MFTVTPHYQIMDKLRLIDSSRKLVSICAISFVISLYLILQISVQTSDVTGLNFSLGYQIEKEYTIKYLYIGNKI